MSRNEYDPIDALATFAIHHTVQAVPQEVLAFQSLRLLDNLGCLAAGYQQSGTSTALNMARRWSGCTEAHILGSREKLAAPQAAFVNAVRARALDYCDVLSPGWHPSSSDIPVALATAELGEATGAEMLAALAIGQDIGQRINLAAQHNGFFYRGFDSNILGLFSGVIIASRLLKLDTQQCRNAIGLAFDAGIGTFQHYQDKTLAVRVSQGMVARHAIEAALLAKEGISGPRRILCGENGFFNLYAPGKPALEHLTTGLGHVFMGREATCFKLYPHCSILLALTDTLINYVLPERFMPGPDTPILLRASPTMRMVCGAEYIPEQTPEIDAQFSARYIIANALLRKRATPAEFSAKAALSPSVIALAKNITIQEVAEFERFDQSELIFTAPDGETRTLASAWGRGWPENPLTMQDIAEKFRICCALSPCPGFNRRASEIIRLIEQLATSTSLLPLMALLGGEEA